MSAQTIKVTYDEKSPISLSDIAIMSISILLDKDIKKNILLFNRVDFLFENIVINSKDELSATAYHLLKNYPKYQKVFCKGEDFKVKEVLEIIKKHRIQECFYAMTLDVEDKYRRQLPPIFPKDTMSELINFAIPKDVYALSRLNKPWEKLPDPVAESVPEVKSVPEPKPEVVSEPKPEVVSRMSAGTYGASLDRAIQAALKPLVLPELDLTAFGTSFSYKTFDIHFESKGTTKPLKNNMLFAIAYPNVAIRFINDGKDKNQEKHFLSKIPSDIFCALIYIPSKLCGEAEVEYKSLIRINGNFHTDIPLKSGRLDYPVVVIDSDGVIWASLIPNIYMKMLCLDMKPILKDMNALKEVVARKTSVVNGGTIIGDADIVTDDAVTDDVFTGDAVTDDVFTDDAVTDDAVTDVIEMVKSGIKITYGEYLNYVKKLKYKDVVKKLESLDNIESDIILELYTKSNKISNVIELETNSYIVYKMLKSKAFRDGIADELSVSLTDNIDIICKELECGTF